MKTLTLLIILIMGLSSCYNQRKATVQTGKAFRKYPALIAGMAREKFPCITTATDSTGFLQSQQQSDSLLAVLEKTAILHTINHDQLQEHIERAKKDSLAVVNCGSMITAAIAHGRRYQEQAVEFAKTIHSLRSVIRDRQPVIQRIEDSAKIFLAGKAVTTADIKYRVSQSLYEQERDAHSKLQGRLRWAIIVPWWILLLISAIIILFTRNWIGKQVLPILRSS